MDKANKKGAIKKIKFVGGVVVPDWENYRMKIPPETSFDIDFLDENEPVVEIPLKGEYISKEEEKSSDKESNDGR